MALSSSSFHIVQIFVGIILLLLNRASDAYENREGFFRGTVGTGGIAHGIGLGGEIQFRNIACASEFSCELPKKYQGQVNGTFVCRTRYDFTIKKDVTFATCIPTNHSVQGDSCGCCGQPCPQPCSQCPCNITSRSYYGHLVGGEGAEVLIANYPSAICVPKLVSMSLVATSGGKVTCNTACTPY